MSLHPLLQFGDIDAALLNHQSDKTGRAVTVCIYKSTVLQNKDRVACQVFDGGTAYEYPAEGVAYGVRLVMRAQAMDLARIKDGLIIRLAPDTIIHTLKSSEKVLDCYHCDIVEEWPGMRQTVVNVVNNPLSKPGAPSEPVYNPLDCVPNVQNMMPTPVKDQSCAAMQREPSLQATAPNTNAHNSSSSYGPERTARPPVAVRADVEPYAPVKQRPSPAKYLKISDLTSYVDKWRILARVTNKSDVREYRNARGDGKLFSVDLIDSEGVEIKGTFFNDAVDRFGPLLKKNGIYSFSKGQIKAVNPRFKKFDHMYELTFGLDAEIAEEEEASAGASGDGGASGGSIPLACLNPRSLAEVETVEVDALLDVICYCYQVYETSQIVIRSTGNRKDKRTVQVIDQSGMIVPLTLWGSDCGLLPAGSWSHKQPPAAAGGAEVGGNGEFYLAVKKAKVDDFNGRKLSSAMGCVQLYVFNVDAHQWFSDVEEAENVQVSLVPKQIRELQAWVATQKLAPGGLQGTRTATSSSSGGAMVKTFHTIADMLNECQTMANEQLTSGAYFNVVATIVETNITPHRKFYWAACGGCGKKLQGGPDANADSFGMGSMVTPYTCAQCNITVDTPDRKYIFTMDIQDYTNTVRISALGDSGRELFDGKTANELEELKTRRGPNGEEFQDLVQGLRRQEFLFKICARNETWQDETRIKYRMLSAQKLTGEGLVSYLGKQKDFIDSLIQ